MNVKAENLYLNYGKDEILSDMNFEMDGPKIYGLLGRNGAGKTTLLSLIGSLREPTSGNVLVNGEIPFENAKIMQQVAFLYNKNFEGETDSPTTLVKHMTRYRPNFDLTNAQRLLKKFKLEENKAVSKLSTGKQSAFKAVIGLASRSPITIFDEVYLGMDAPARDLFYKELRKDQELHPRIVILSTHLVSEMDYLFDDVLIIKDGKILLHESYDDVVSRGVTVVGNKQVVDQFVDGREILNEEHLGDTRSVTLYGELTQTEQMQAEEMGLNVGPVSLQDLFIQLTKEDE